MKMALTGKMGIRAVMMSAACTAVLVKTLLPNPDDPSQTINGTRVGRFGWKARVPNLVQFAVDAYVNEMGITTQHCVCGTSVLAFATESKPNSNAVAAACDDRGPGGGLGLGVQRAERIGPQRAARDAEGDLASRARCRCEILGIDRVSETNSDVDFVVLNTWIKGC
jgi:hypothetical protein